MQIKSTTIVKGIEVKREYLPVNNDPSLKNNFKKAGGGGSDRI